MKKLKATMLLLAVISVPAQAAEPSDCEPDLKATGEYVLILKEQSDRYEQDIARLKYHVSKWQQENARLQAEKKEVEAKMKEVQR